MLNFTVGPVQMDNNTLKIGGEQIPYFRTKEFSKIMLENESIMKNLLNATYNSRLITLTTSGTGGMEASLLNLFDKNDKLLIINGGSFGKRFCEIAEILELNYTSVNIEFGKTVLEENLSTYENKGYTALVVNLHETSSGVLYDVDLLSKFCKRNDLFFLVDAISCFLCDEIDMAKYNINAIITGSQKALALAPGLCLMVYDSKAIQKVKNNKVKSLYFNIKEYLSDGERGQTPFTPAVGTIMQLNARLKDIESSGGAKAEIEKTKKRADYFRELIKELPFIKFSATPSNGCTSLKCANNISAKKLFEILKNEFNIFICPNGGSYADIVFRVGHMGALELKDYDELISSIKKVLERGII